MLQTTITGSLPKPSWLADPTCQLFAPWVAAPARLDEAQDDAVRLAVSDQESAGIDIVTDGEQRRRHYILGFLERLSGIDVQTLGQKVTRGGRYGAAAMAVPRVVGALGRPHPVTVAGLRFVKALTRRPIKVTLPGPMTIVDSIVDEHFLDGDGALAMRFADLLNVEARELASAGADVIQLDEPCFNIHLANVREWGIAALDRAFAGVAARTAVHICYGYGIPAAVAWKSSNREWGHYAETLPLLAQSSVMQVSLELAASGVDMSVLRLLPEKDIMLGVIDVGADAIETAEQVAERIRRALRFADADRLYPCTDCGMVPRPRSVARAKMRALVQGASLVRDGLASTPTYRAAISVK